MENIEFTIWSIAELDDTMFFIISNQFSQHARLIIYPLDDWSKIGVQWRVSKGERLICQMQNQCPSTPEIKMSNAAITIITGYPQWFEVEDDGA